ncbi:ABC-type multidrug transport system ATPase subunit [Actinoalloteichus hoggarensis]|uniref:SkfA peptide export ATP-binding protein SkfE n=1 Tax=Actinoalloteichus hoggarensis TaxID=1470176 RepID=A0A221W5Z3_9PSEU|nr:ABC transporter ATP-binding protein [Actinoalloteichus hoggarensis]ASO21362.1 SkfA peptide export ATP-binding protein SkfE [Actinoalloteichus hoggarensis]MBB5921295.1 ABC-type multidrug transport system ATPase subunit [Actinoalloteichus hoggarensis]
MLQVTDLLRRFGTNTVLDQISFTTAPGRATVLVGPNGAGKTTLLRCVAGVDHADEGEVRWAGREIRESDPRIRAAMAVGLDDVDFFPDVSVVEHLDLLARAHGDSDPEEMLDDVLAELGLSAIADRLPGTLSSGQRRRLGLASCFVRPRELLVLDEPEQRLDAAGRRWLVERLLAEKAAGVAILLSCHDEDVTSAVADECVPVGRG